MLDLTFYTLLHVRLSDPKIKLAENSNSGLLEYVRCCEALQSSLDPYGFKLTVLTNDVQLLARYSSKLEFEKIEFHLNVPTGIKFYSAHYKIDVFKYLSNKSGYSILLDCDIVCINEMPRAMELLINQNIPMYYDITNQIYPGNGRDRMAIDKEILMSKKSNGMWSGGEFISGTSSFFEKIYERCIQYWPKYVENYNLLHHNGDEMLTSCAVEEYQLQDGFIYNIDTVGGLNRYWSADTLHVQKAFKASLDNFLLHLPRDKKIIAKHSEFKLTGFLTEYKRYVFFKKTMLIFIKPLKRIIKIAKSTK